MSYEELDQLSVLEIADRIDEEDTPDDALEEWMQFMDEAVTAEWGEVETGIHQDTICNAIRKGHLGDIKKIKTKRGLRAWQIPRWKLYAWAGEYLKSKIDRQKKAEAAQRKKKEREARKYERISQVMNY